MKKKILIVFVSILCVGFSLFVSIDNNKNCQNWTDLNASINASTASAEGSENGRPLMSNGTLYCCANSGNDCAAARCN